MPEASNLSTPLAYALAYAALGWRVFPLEPRTKVPLGKLVPRGMLDATTEAEDIRRWWKAAPSAGIGIALAPSGLVALDIDPRNGGSETFDALQAAHGSLRSDVMAMTGGGGEHHVFLIPPGAHITLPGTLGAGVDVKANGYIVVEPSLHPNGKQYVWEASSNPLDGITPSPLPDWLRSLRVQLPDMPSVAMGDKPVDPALARDLREALYVLGADDRETWLRAGMALHSTGWGAAAFAMWCAWSQQSQKFDAADQRKTWESFKTPSERGNGLSPAWVFGQAQAVGWVNPRAAIVRATEEPPPPEHPEEAASAAEVGDRLPLIWCETVQIDDINTKQIVEDVLTEGGLSVMYGESNSGKSFLACDMDCHIATGMDWLGKRTVQGAVLYVAGEGAESIKMRTLAWRQEHGLNPALAIVPVSVNLLDGNADLTKIIYAALDAEQHYGMPVTKITVDTLARAFGGGNENASEDMGAVIAHADRIRESTRAHLQFIHHQGKDASKGSRGHSSLKAATDTEIEVSGDELTKLHLVKITKQRDLSTRGMELTTRFRVVEMGQGQWGKPLTTCIVEETTDRMVKSNKDRANELQTALVVALANATGRTMRKAELVRTMSDAGFKSSSIYRTLQQLVDDGTLTEAAGGVHLNSSRGGI